MPVKCVRQQCIGRRPRNMSATPEWNYEENDHDAGRSFSYEIMWIFRNPIPIISIARKPQSVTELGLRIAFAFPLTWRKAPREAVRKETFHLPKIASSGNTLGVPCLGKQATNDVTKQNYLVQQVLCCYQRSLNASWSACIVFSDEWLRIFAYSINGVRVGLLGILNPKTIGFRAWTELLCQKFKCSVYVRNQRQFNMCLFITAISLVERRACHLRLQLQYPTSHSPLDDWGLGVYCCGSRVQSNVPPIQQLITWTIDATWGSFLLP